MRIFGIDFTSRPKRQKPITCIECELSGENLVFQDSYDWSTFQDFEAHLRKDGPWISGIDFPFGQARRFIDTIGWPDNWRDYVRHAESLGRDQFVDDLNQYRVGRQAGDKEHRRRTDVAAKSLSPQKLYGVPVAKMFFEGAPRLLHADVTIPGLIDGSSQRIVVEAYPGVLARHLIGKTSYKHDQKSKQTPVLHEARIKMIDKILAGSLKESYGLMVQAPRELAEDPTGDKLDALLCAIQAAWAWTKRESNFGIPPEYDPLEGWIADPLIPQ